MNTGQIISGVGHLGLIGFVLFGGAFKSEPLPFTVTEVTTLSAAEFDALFDAPASPEAVAQVDTPQPPEAGQAPDLASVPDVVPEVAPPEPAEAAQPDATPEVLQPAPVEAEVSDQAPVLAPPPEDFAALVPEVAEEASPQTAPRVAPEVVEAPEPDVQIDDVDQQAVSPDVGELPAETEEQEETAREEAAERLETEALSAPARSLRPQVRPTRRPEPEVAEPEEPQVAEQPDPEPNAVDDAVAAALAGNGADTGAADQPVVLSSGQSNALIAAISREWIVDPGALSSRVVVEVLIDVDGNGKLRQSPKLIKGTGGDNAAINAAFMKARIAVFAAIRNGSIARVSEEFPEGLEFIAVFNPEDMRLR